MWGAIGAVTSRPELLSDGCEQRLANFAELVGVAIAIAAVLFVSRRVGSGFLVAAFAIALARVFIGLHYPALREEG